MALSFEVICAVVPCAATTAGPDAIPVIHGAKAHCPRPHQPNSKLRANYIANDPVLSSIEIKALRCENAKLRRVNAQKVFIRDLEMNGKRVDAKEFTRTRAVIHIMVGAVQNVLSSRSSEEDLKLFRIHKDHLDALFQNGGTVKF